MKELLESIHLINENKDLSPDEFVLKFGKRNDIPVSLLATQIICRKKVKAKWQECPESFLFPNTKSLEQCSGIKTAEYKSNLLKSSKIIDLCGGLGIDSFCFSRKSDETHYIELDKNTANFFSHNFGKHNINIHNADAIETLSSFEDNYFDWIYADPARRAEQGRILDLRKCSPNIHKHKELLNKKAKNWCIKVSPAYDKQAIKNLLPEINQFIWISVNGENKELLVLTKKENYSRKAVVITKNTIFEITNEKETVIASKTDEIKDFIFLPDAAIRTAKLSDTLAAKMNLESIGSSFYTSNNKPKFPGKIYKTIEQMPYKPKLIEKFLKKENIKKANINRIGFDIKESEIRKKLKIKNGGEHSLLFYKNHQNEFKMILTKQILEA